MKRAKRKRRKKTKVEMRTPKGIDDISKPGREFILLVHNSRKMDCFYFSASGNYRPYLNEVSSVNL